MKKQKKASVTSEQAVDMLVHNNWTASSDHLTIITPLTLFYKIRDEKTGKLLHAAVYPGAMSCDYQPNNAALHQHDHFELMYVLDGELTNKIERISYTYKKGDACLLNRNTRHTDIPGQRCSVVFINFHAQYILELMEKDVLELSPKSHRRAGLSMISALQPSGRGTFCQKLSGIFLHPAFPCRSVRRPCGNDH